MGETYMKKGGENNMMKKFIAAAGAGALFLSMVSPVFAGFPFPQSKGDLTIKNIDTVVVNKVVTKADSGDNSIGGMMVMGGKITTGGAFAAADLTTVVNDTQVVGCNCFKDISIKNIDAKVINKVTTKADSGDNSIGGKIVMGGKIRTGDAIASSILGTSVNTIIIGDVELP